MFRNEGASWLPKSKRWTCVWPQGGNHSNAIFTEACKRHCFMQTRPLNPSFFPFGSAFQYIWEACCPDVQWVYITHPGGMKGNLAIEPLDSPLCASHLPVIKPGYVKEPAKALSLQVL